MYVCICMYVNIPGSVFFLCMKYVKEVRVSEGQVMRHTCVLCCPHGSLFLFTLMHLCTSGPITIGPHVDSAELDKKYLKQLHLS